MIRSHSQSPISLARLVESARLALATIAVTPIVDIVGGVFMALRAMSFGSLPLCYDHPFPAFPEHIPHIVQGRTQKQVVGIDTAGSVAAMKDGETIRDWTIGQLPCKSMHALFLTPDVHPAVSGVIGETHPKKASGVGLWHDQIRNSLFYWWRVSHSRISITGGINSQHAPAMRIV